MVRWWVALMSVAACGRIGFQPLGNDGATGDDDGSAADDADACALPSGLIGYWPMNQGDTTGSVLVDRSASGHDGTIIGTAPVTVTGRVAEGLDFAATTAYVTFPALPVQSGAGQATTVAIWFFQPSTPVSGSIVYLPSTPIATDPRYDLWLDDQQNGTPTLCINGGVGDCWGVADPNLIGRWVHLVAIMVSGPTSNGSLFIDGAPVVMGCLYPVACAESRTVMAPITLNGEDTTYRWRGKFDELMMFDRALTPTEIATLYACQSK